MIWPHDWQRSRPLGQILCVMTSLVALLAVWVGVPALAASAGPGKVAADAVQVLDLGLKSGFQDRFFGHFKRGRATIAADFDLDGRIDFYMGNPGDESFVLRNVTISGEPRFEPVQTLLRGELAWGAVAFDYDNDGDYDIFVTGGGNEGKGFNHLFRNQWMETGRLRFTDVTDLAGVAGAIPRGETRPVEDAHRNAVVVDFDRNGYGDLFVNVAPWEGVPADLKGRNILWRNNGDGTFTDVTNEVGLGVTRRPTQHSTFFDFDNDGDFDLYENNIKEANVLWRNRLVEDGATTFEDVTTQFSPPGEDLAYPRASFGSAAADLNNDGWEDLLVTMRGSDPEPSSPYPAGHALFLNLGGTGFVNVAQAAGLNADFQDDQGVMGCQIGDVTGDGTPDIYVGNGGPPYGQYDQYFEADSAFGANPHFSDQTALIDFPAPQGQGIAYPPYPYRTHGISFVDVDNDGSLEVAVSNGGPAAQPDEVREPNRLFKFIRPSVPNWLKVRAVGDGVTVSKDAVGTRFALTVRNDRGDTWTIHRTLFAGSCFSAQNGFEVHFGLRDATAIQSLKTYWPDGVEETLTSGLSVNTSIVVGRSRSEGRVSPGAPTGDPWSRARIAAELAANRPFRRSAGHPIVSAPVPVGPSSYGCNS